MNTARIAFAGLAAAALAATMAPASALAAAPQAKGGTVAKAAKADCNRKAAKKLYVYWDAKCNTAPIGYTTENDGNWGDGQRSFQGSDDNKATSLINNTDRAVFFYKLPGYKTKYKGKGGYYFCVSAHKRVWSLNPRDAAFKTFRKWHNGSQANNQISSHRFVDRRTC